MMDALFGDGRWRIMPGVILTYPVSETTARVVIASMSVVSPFGVCPAIASAIRWCLSMDSSGAGVQVDPITVVGHGGGIGGRARAVRRRRGRLTARRGEHEAHDEEAHDRNVRTH